MSDKPKKKNQPTAPFDRIMVVHADNARTIYRKVEELAADIKENGLKEPLGVRIEDRPEDGWPEAEREALGLEEGDDGPEWAARLVYGFRRYFAIEHIRSEDDSLFDDVPVVLEETKSELDRAYANLIENISREELTPGEMSDAFYKLNQMSQSVKDISRRVPSLSYNYIVQLVSLRKKLTDKPWEAFYEGKISFEVAKEIGKHDSAAKQEKLLETAMEVAAESSSEKRKKGVSKKVKEESGKSKTKPATKEVKSLFEQYAEPENNYERGVHFALAWILGERKSVPEAKKAEDTKLTVLPPKPEKKAPKGKKAGKKAPKGAKSDKAPTGKKPAGKPSGKPVAKPAGKKTVAPAKVNKKVKKPSEEEVE